MDALIGNRKVCLENGEDAVEAQLLHFTRLEDGIRDRRCRNPRNDRDAAARSPDDNLDHSPALEPSQIREFTGLSQRSQSMHTGSDKIIAEAIQHLVHDIARWTHRRDKVWKDSVECPIDH